MSILSSVHANRAKQFARSVDKADSSASRASKRKSGNVRVDNTAPVTHVDAITGKTVVVRQPMDALGTVRVLAGKSHGTIATPRSYTIWLKAGMPAHPIYNPEAWKRERYVNGVALPTGGKPVETAAVRHERDCNCRICAEFKRSLEQRKPVADPRIDPRTFKGFFTLKAEHITKDQIAGHKPLRPPLAGSRA